MPERVELLREARRAILEAEDAVLPVEVRRAVYARAEHFAGGGSASGASALDEPLRRFVDKVALHSYKVMDEDVAALADAGLSEDAVFEAVIAASVAAGLARLEIGLAALDGRK